MNDKNLFNPVIVDGDNNKTDNVSKNEFINNEELKELDSNMNNGFNNNNMNNNMNNGFNNDMNNNMNNNFNNNMSSNMNNDFNNNTNNNMNNGFNNNMSNNMNNDFNNNMNNNMNNNFNNNMNNNFNNNMNNNNMNNNMGNNYNNMPNNNQFQQSYVPQNNNGMMYGIIGVLLVIVIGVAVYFLFVKGGTEVLKCTGSDSGITTSFELKFDNGYFTSGKLTENIDLSGYTDEQIGYIKNTDICSTVQGGNEIIEYANCKQSINNNNVTVTVDLKVSSSVKNEKISVSNLKKEYESSGLTCK